LGEYLVDLQLENFNSQDLADVLKLLCAYAFQLMRWLKALVPVPKCIFQGAIEDVNADFEKTLDGIPVPPHLLRLRHAFGYDPVNSRFSKAGRDP
jgi:hypothetical protein